MTIGLLIGDFDLAVIFLQPFTENDDYLQIAPRQGLPYLLATKGSGLLASYRQAVC